MNKREWADDRRGRPQLGLKPTPRQIEVFLAVLRLSSARAAARSLGVTISTVKTHGSMLMARLGAQSTAQAAGMLWRRFPNLRPLMGLPNGQLGQRPERRKRRRRRL